MSRTCFAFLFSDFAEKRKDKKKNMAFLLV
jgi:hypothetical protein